MFPNARLVARQAISRGIICAIVLSFTTQPTYAQVSTPPHDLAQYSSAQVARVAHELRILLAEHGDTLQVSDAIRDYLNDPLRNPVPSVDSLIGALNSARMARRDSLVMMDVRSLGILFADPTALPEPLPRLSGEGYWPQAMSAPSTFVATSSLIYGGASFIIDRAKLELLSAHLDDVLRLLKAPPLDAFTQNSRRTLEQMKALDARLALASLRGAVAADLTGAPRVLTGGDLRPTEPVKARLHDYASVLVSLAERTMGGEDPVRALSSLRGVSGDTSSWPRMVGGADRDALIIIGAIAAEYRFDPPAIAAVLKSPGEQGALFVSVLLEKLEGEPTISESARVQLRAARQRSGEVLDVVRLIDELHALGRTAREALAQGADPLPVYFESLRRLFSLLEATSATQIPPEEATHALHATAPLVLGIYDAWKAARYTDLSRQLYTLLGTTEIPPGTGFRTLLVLASLVEASDGETVSEILAQAVEAPRGYLRKQDRRSVTVTAYPGFSLGYERVAGSHGISGPLALPIAVEFSFGRLAVSAAILDLGNAIRPLVGSDAEPMPELGIEQVLAPGAGLAWRPSRTSPLVVASFWQFTPSLRRIRDDAGRADSHRFSIIGAVDVSLFTLWQGHRSVPWLARSGSQ